MPAANACGVVGAWFAYHLYFYLGDGSFPLLLFMTLTSALRLVNGTVGSRWERTFGLALVVSCTAASAHLVSSPGSGALPIGHGGLVGFWFGDFLWRHLDRLGTLIVVGACLVVGLVFATEGWVLKLPAVIRRVGRSSAPAMAMAKALVAATAGVRAAAQGGGVTSNERTALLDSPRRGRKRKARELGSLVEEDDEEADEEEAEDAVLEVEDDVEAADESDEAWEEEEDEEDAEVAAEGDIVAERSVDARTLPIVNFPTAQTPPPAEAYPRRIENWELPSLDLLGVPEYGFCEQQESFVRQQARVLEQTLEEFRLDARVVEIDTGPVITMFELRLGAGIKVSQIVSLSNDIARALKAHAIRVVAPISGKNTVGIEVPNQEKEQVRLHELMTSAGKRASEMNLPLFLGKDAGGGVLVTDLTKMPHMLIAGTTGSGKSVCINAVILSLLMTKRPDHVKMILIDPKMVEMSQFKGTPHLMCPIVTDMAKAEKILEWAVTKMDERYELLAEARVKNVRAFNNLGEEELFRRLEPSDEEEKARIATHLPYIVIVIDELADLMMTSAKEVEHHLSRLAQKSRAVGIHIIVATQRPEAKVVTGLIKSNLPSRVCFRVASRMDSRIVLDQNGGEVLLGQGDMLFLPPGSHKLVRAQGTFLDDAEIHAVLEDLESRAKPEFHPELIRLRMPNAEGGGGVRDPLFEQAVKIVVESQRGSVSLLQRRLTIGYSRASRLVDQMGDAGIVGEHKGSQAREVLLTSEQWAALQRQTTADLEAGYAADADDDWDSTDAQLVDSAG